MTKIAAQLEYSGWVLRSGGAAGADAAFQEGVGNADNQQIFYPSATMPQALIDLAVKYHPIGERILVFPEKVVQLIARNGYQILGPDLTSPSKLVVCWTPDGLSGCGAGQAIRIAKAYGIPVVELFGVGSFEDAMDKIYEVVI
jgi:hypothetical protein